VTLAKLFCGQFDFDLGGGGIKLGSVSQNCGAKMAAVWDNGRVEEVITAISIRIAGSNGRETKRGS